MHSVKTPLTRSVSLACGIFIILLIAVIALASYRLYTQTMYDRYEAQMSSIATYVGAHIDNDDMSECADTFVESEKYKEFQAFLDEFVDYYTDLHYVYLMKISDPGEPIPVYEICAGNTTYEKENEPESVMHLGDGEPDWYDDEFVQKFREVLEGDEDTFMIDPSAWGVDYTLLRPLIDSSGKHYGLLCVDVSLDQINATIYHNIYANIAVIAFLGLVFILLLLLWMRSNVTKPLRQLENSVAVYANASAGRRDPDDLIFKAPQINTRNEVKSLSDAISKLSEDMRDYVNGMLDAENIAYQDALTLVKSRASYGEKARELDQAILDQNAKFAIVMIDLNSLKVINDKYGHDRGNEYIIGSCNLVCDVYTHSPVYRVGGDEFIVVLEGQDYENRDALLAEIQKALAESAQNTDADPWNRYSAATGMAVYEPGDTVDTVFGRADEEMYRVKAQMKASRNRQ